MLDGFIAYIILIISLFVFTFLAFSNIKYKNKLLTIAFVIFTPLAFGVVIDQLSRPKPIEMILPWDKPNPKEAKMLASYMKQNQYIMLLLTWDGLEYPRYFKFPWNKKMAEQIEQAKRGARRQDGTSRGVIIYKPFDASLERRKAKWAYPKPQESKPVHKQHQHLKIIRIPNQ